uniref:Uncharacterized protein n=1 Tax=Oryza punctata TaxID=4537 RepID=A0A0E0M8I7_ORYPU
MAFLDTLYGGGSGGSRRRVTVKGEAGRRRRWAVAAPRPVRQLYWKLRSRLRSSKLHVGGAAATARFGYDLQSYCRNFDDGIDRLRLATASRPPVAS